MSHSVVVRVHCHEVGSRLDEVLARHPAVNMRAAVDVDGGG